MERFASLDEVEGLVHAITTRSGGVSLGAFAALNLGRGCGDEPGAVARNRERARRSLGFKRFLIPRQVHGCTIATVSATATPSGDDREGCDGLATDRPGVLLGVLGADCPGVLLVAPRRRALAVVHAGWRGVVAGMAPAAVELLEQRYGVSAGALRVGIGPGISAARYEVSRAVADAIGSAVPAASRHAVVLRGRPGHAQVDLGAALVAQLVACGVLPANIEVHPACTYDDERFFSHRRDRGVTGRHALVAGWSAETR